MHDNSLFPWFFGSPVWRKEMAGLLLELGLGPTRLLTKPAVILLMMAMQQINPAKSLGASG